MKKHLFSAHNDLKTWFLCKSFLAIGFVLLIIYVLQIAFHFLPIDSNTEGALLGFAILFIGIGLISYFFSCQFAKLSSIADEIENDETLMDEEPVKE